MFAPVGALALLAGAVIGECLRFYERQMRLDASARLEADRAQAKADAASAQEPAPSLEGWTATTFTATALSALSWSGRGEYVAAEIRRSFPGRYFHVRVNSGGIYVDGIGFDPGWRPAPVSEALTPLGLELQESLVTASGSGWWASFKVKS